MCSYCDWQKKVLTLGLSQYLGEQGNLFFVSVPHHSSLYNTITYNTTPHNTIQYHTLPYHTIPTQSPALILFRSPLALPNLSVWQRDVSNYNYLWKYISDDPILPRNYKSLISPLQRSKELISKIVHASQTNEFSCDLSKCGST